MKGILTKVGIFVVAMLLVSAGLIVIFGEFRFTSTNRYHATFADASRLGAVTTYGSPVSRSARSKP